MEQQQICDFRHHHTDTVIDPPPNPEMQILRNTWPEMYLDTFFWSTTKTVVRRDT